MTSEGSSQGNWSFDDIESSDRGDITSSVRSETEPPSHTSSLPDSPSPAAGLPEGDPPPTLEGGPAFLSAWNSSPISPCPGTPADPPNLANATSPSALLPSSLSSAGCPLAKPERLTPPPRPPSPPPPPLLPLRELEEAFPESSACPLSPPPPPPAAPSWSRSAPSSCETMPPAPWVDPYHRDCKRRRGKGKNVAAEEVEVVAMVTSPSAVEIRR